MNDRPQRNESADRGPGKRRDGSGRPAGRPRGERGRDERRDSGGADQGGRARQQGGRPFRGRDGGDRDERRPRREYGDRDERRPRRDGDERRPRRDGERQGGERGSDRARRDDRQQYGRGGTRGGGRSDRGGRDREYTEAERLQHELRPVRSEHRDPVIPDDVQAKDLHPAARNELKTLQADVQDRVARHLAMVAMLIDDDPELAHQHALSASRRAGRIPVTRETLAITAYRLGDFSLALRELRTYRRLSGLDGHAALVVDCERGLGRPEKAIETGLEVDAEQLDTEQRVHLAIAMSGARLDVGQTQQALFELEIPELNPRKAFSWSPELFAAYAAVLEDLGRDSEARTWQRHADRAAAALQDHLGAMDELEVFEIFESLEEADRNDEAALAETGEPIAEPRPEAGAPRSFEEEIAAEVDELLADPGVVDAAADRKPEVDE